MSTNAPTTPAAVKPATATPAVAKPATVVPAVTKPVADTPQVNPVVVMLNRTVFENRVEILRSLGDEAPQELRNEVARLCGVYSVPLQWFATNGAYINCDNAATRASTLNNFHFGSQAEFDRFDKEVNEVREQLVDKRDLAAYKVCGPYARIDAYGILSLLDEVEQKRFVSRMQSETMLLFAERMTTGSMGEMAAEIQKKMANGGTPADAIQMAVSNGGMIDMAKNLMSGDSEMKKNLSSMLGGIDISQMHSEKSKAEMNDMIESGKLQNMVSAMANTPGMIPGLDAKSGVPMDISAITNIMQGGNFQEIADKMKDMMMQAEKAEKAAKNKDEDDEKEAERD